jgi:predicted transcriptional regulator
MNTQKQVFNKLFSNEKVELASQKFEFAIYDDVKALLNIASASVKKADAADQKAFKLKDSLNATISESKQLSASAADLTKKSNAIMAKLKENAKMFGFDIKTTDAYKLNEELLRSIEALGKYSGLGKVIAGQIIQN